MYSPLASTGTNARVLLTDTSAIAFSSNPKSPDQNTFGAAVSTGSEPDAERCLLTTTGENLHHLPPISLLLKYFWVLNN